MVFKNSSYWLDDTPPLNGDSTPPQDGGIAIIGSGISGVSTAYFLHQLGFKHITLIDDQCEKSASFRNCGHILYGTVESMKALNDIHGEEKAKEIWQFSIEICHEVRESVEKLNLEAEYKQDGYLVIAIDESENKEIEESIDILNKMGFQSSLIPRNQLLNMGFNNIFSARYEHGSAQIHPIKFRNGLLQYCLNNNIAYHSNCNVTKVSESNGKVEIIANNKRLSYDAAVIATNAYSPLLSDFFKTRQLIEPYRGQILASTPLKEKIPISYPHSFDHGYEYALSSRDNRLLIGGWRNQVPAKEIGIYDLETNFEITQGLIEFVKKHYTFKNEITWEYSWSGIMASSKTGFPFIGPTNSTLIFTCAGYTGHGLSWAHGSAKLLAKIMAGQQIPSVARYFNPNSIS
ncbi:MAG: FAD-dependent oxidoreductase [Bdellovibrionota bacterium]